MPHRAVLFALLSIVAVACSSSGSTSGPAASSVDAGTSDAAFAASNGDAASSGSEDAGGGDASDAATTVMDDGGTCPASIGAFPESEWFHPMHPLTKGSCTTQDLDTLSKIGLGSYAARRSLVSAACAACVFSDAADPTWGLLIVVDPDTALTNYSGCSIVAGDTRDCVKQNSAWRFCTRKACSKCDPANQDQCAENQSMSGQCQPFYDADAACGGDWPATCATSDDMIANYCG